MTAAVHGVEVGIFRSQGGDDAPDPAAPAIVGSGILLDPGHVLTCAHVVAEALGIEETQAEPPGQWLDLDIHEEAAEAAEAGEAGRHRAEVIAWLPVKAGRRLEDVALLRLREPLEGRRAFPSWCDLRSDDYPNRRFLAIGFGREDGDSAAGKCLAGNRRGWVKLKPDEEEIGRGYSGGPVVDEKSHRLIGMLVAYYRGERVTYMIPAQRLRDFIAPHLEPPDRLARLLSRTFDRRPQLDRLQGLGVISGTPADGPACLLFECRQADEPLFLAHHALLDSHLHQGGVPALSSRQLEPPEVRPLGPGAGAFRQALDLAVGGHGRWLAQPGVGKIVYLELPLSLQLPRHLAGIAEFLACKRAEDPACPLAVLVACPVDGVARPLRPLYRLWCRLGMRKAGVVIRLAPLGMLRQDDLAVWDPPAAYAGRFAEEVEGRTLPENLSQLLPAGRKRPYRDLKDDLERTLARHRLENPA